MTKMGVREIFRASAGSGAASAGLAVGAQTRQTHDNDKIVLRAKVVIVSILLL
jgi:hypothetical protein